MDYPPQQPQPNTNMSNLTNMPGSPPAKKFVIPESAKLALLLFLLAGSLSVALLPHTISRTTTTPSFGLFLATGLVMVILTALLFTYLNRLNLGFGKTALVMAAGYNSVIAIIKFLLAPHALYTTNQQTDFIENGIGGSPNNPGYYMVTGIVILLLYMLVFRMVYKHFRKRLNHQTEGMKVKSERPNLRRIVLLALKVICIVIGGGILLILALLGGGSGVDYLQYIFTGSAAGLPLLVAIALAIYLAYRGFEDVNKQITATGNATLLAGFFWLGLSLIVLYHIMWIIFMITLVNLWPFRTYAPK